MSVYEAGPCTMFVLSLNRGNKNHQLLLVVITHKAFSSGGFDMCTHTWRENLTPTLGAKTTSFFQSSAPSCGPVIYKKIFLLVSQEHLVS